MGNATVGSLRAVLEADVSQFNASMAGASTAAKKWGSDFAAVGASAKELGKAFSESLDRNMTNVTRLAKEFSGANIAKSADEMAIAISRVGSADALTATEQAKVNALMTEALAKYKALGLEAPAHIQKLADSTHEAAESMKGAGESTNVFHEKWIQLAAGVASGEIFLKVGERVLEFGKQLIEGANRVVDLSAKTGLSLKAVQQFGVVAEQTGTNVDDFTTAIFKLGVNVSEGGDKTKRGLKDLGLSFADIKDLKPEEQFDKVARALEEMESPTEANRIAVELFGKSAGAVLPAIRDHYKEIMESAVVSSDAQIKALHSASSEWERFTQKISGAATMIAGDTVSAFSHLDTSLEGLMLLAKGDIAGFQALGIVTGELNEVAEHGSEGWKEVAKNMLAAGNNAKTIAPVVGQTVEAVERYARSLRNALTPEQLAARVAADALTESTTKLPVALGAAVHTMVGLGLSTSEIERRFKEAGQDVSQFGLAIDRLVESHKQEIEAQKKAGEPLERYLRNLTTLDDKIHDAMASGVAYTDIIRQLGAEADKAATEAAQFGIPLSKLPFYVQQINAAFDRFQIKDALDRASADSRAGFQKLLDTWKTEGDKQADAELKQIEQATGAATAIGDAYIHEFGTTIDVQLNAAEQWKIKSLASIQALAKAYPEAFQFAKTQIVAIYGDMTDRAIAFGFATRFDLQKQAVAFKANYDKMVASGKYTAEELRKAWQIVVNAEIEAGDETERLKKKLHDIGLQIPQMLADGFKSGNIKQAIGQVADTLGAAIGEHIGTAIGGPLGGAIGHALGGLVSMIGGLLSDHGRGKVVDFGETFGGLDALHAKLMSTLDPKTAEKFWIQLTQNTHSDDDALKTIGEIKTALQDASKAAGEMKQAVAMKHVTDALAGNGLWDQFTKNAIAAGKVGDQVIDGLADAMAKQLGRVGSGTAAVAAGFSSTSGLAFQRLTGFSTKDADDALAQLKDLQDRSDNTLSIDEQRQLAAAKKTMADIVKGGGAVTAALQQQYDDASDVAARLSAKGHGALSDTELDLMNTLLDKQKAIGAANAEIVSGNQEEFDRISRITLASFNTYRAQGKSTVEAVEAIGPAIDDLKAAADRFGFAGSSAYDQLERWRDLTKTNAPLLDEISGLNALLTASANLGTLTADSFKDLEQQGESAYDKLIGAGFTEQEALVQMEPMLKSLIKLHNERGLAIDDETQKLIDQAHQQGLLQDDQLSTNDILETGLGRIIELLGGDLPDAWKKMGDHAGDAMDDATQHARDLHDALNSLTDREYRIPIGLVSSDSPDLQVPRMPDLPGFATGTGGRYLDFGTGTAVMLHGQERVMTKGEGESGTSTNIFELDGRTLARVIVKHVPGELQRIGIRA